MNDDAKIERQLRMEVAALRQRVAELERAAQRHSSGKSLPSSFDSPAADPADRAVELLRAKYPQLIEGSRDGYVLLEMTGAFVYGNTAYCTMLGYSPEELRQLTYRDITPEKWFTLDQRHFDEMEAHGYCGLYEKEYRRRDGTVFPVEIRSYLDRDDKGNALGMWSIVRDITERQRAEETLRLRNRAINAATEGICLTGSPAEGTLLLFANQGFERLTGYRADEMLGQNMRFLQGPGTDDATLERLRAAIRAGEACAVELLNYRKDGQPFWNRLSITPLKDDAGAVTHLVGVLHDVTERRQAEQILAASEMKYRQLVEMTHDLVWSVDREGRITFMSPASRRIYGREPEEMIGRLYTDFVPPEEARRGMVELERALASGEAPLQFENRVYHKDGHEVILLANATVLRDEAGDIVGTVVTSQDITQRHRAEASLRLQASMLDSIGQAVIATDVAGKILYVNSFAQQLYGWSSDKVLGRDVLEVTVPQTTQVQAAEIMARLMNGESWSGEFIVQRHDGTNFPAFVTNTPLLDAQGQLAAIIGVSVDITERKQVEKALRESEEQFRLAQKATNDVIWDWDIVRDLQRWNEAGAVVFGWQEIVEHPQTAAWWVERVHPEDLQRVKQGFYAVTNDPAQDRWTDEYRFRKADGSYAQVVDRGYVVRDAQGRAVRMIGAMLDITERKRAEELLRLQQERLQRTQAVGHVGSWEFDPQSGKIWGSDESFRIFGLPYANEEVPIEEVEACIPDRARVHQALVDLINQGTPYNLDYEVRPADGGSPRVVHSIGELLRDAHSKPLKIIGVVQDITERKQTETALRESERLMHMFTQATNDALWNWDLTTGLVERSVGFEKHFGYRRAEIEPPIEWWVEHVHPEDRARVMATFEAAKAAGEESCSYQYRFQRRDRGYAHVFDRVYFVRDIQGQTVRCLGAMTDITDQKRAEEEIRAAHQRLTYHVENSPLAVVEWDRDFRVQRWSGQAEALFGWSAEEVIGKFPTEWQFVHPDDQPAVEQIMGGLLQGNQPRNLSSNRNFTRDGRVVHCEWYNSALVDPDGHIVSILSLVHDITERKQAEAVVQQSQQQLRALSARLETLREEERTRISREIHDELGQLLTGVKIDLRWMERRVSQMSDTDLQNQMGDKIGGMKGLVDDTIKSVQRIAAELRPGTLDRLGLVAALRDEAERFAARTEIHCDLNLAEPTHEISPEVTTAIFRIFQEILTNVMRHAQATRVQAEFREEQAHWRLTVQDNGCGLPPAVAAGRQSLGLLGMRERAMLLGGTVEINSQAAGGTTVQVTIPVGGKGTIAS